MKQYLDLLKSIQEKGTYKPAARPGMPGTQSLFGYQFRHNLAEGFPLLTTKKVSFKNIAVELLWFLKGDTNIKYLVDNGVNIWNGDAYNYYCKKMKNLDIRFFEQQRWFPVSLEEFMTFVKEGEESSIPNYKFGDCGFQYGRVWREFGEKNVPSGVLKVNGKFSEAEKAQFAVEWGKACNSSKAVIVSESEDFKIETLTRKIDQIKNLIEGLLKTPESRRHIVTAIDPAHDQDLALYWCHCLVQLNCRPLSTLERLTLLLEKVGGETYNGINKENAGSVYALEKCDFYSIPKYYLDCQLYQRSADSVLGVPYNLASYALLTHILAKICNMIPGEFIHTFGDVHIYDNHKEAVKEQLTRIPKELPKLVFKDEFHYLCDNLNKETVTVDGKVEWLLDSLKQWDWDLFVLEGYDPYPPIKAELSTGKV